MLLWPFPPQGSDPDALELLKKIQILQKRVLKMSAELISKEKKIKECMKLYINLQREVSKHPETDVVATLKETQKALRERTEKMKVSLGRATQLINGIALYAAIWGRVYKNSTGRQWKMWKCEFFWSFGPRWLYSIRTHAAPDLISQLQRRVSIRKFENRWIILNYPFAQCLVAELNMSESRSNEYKDDIERLNSELRDVKAKYYTQKRKDEKSRNDEKRKVPSTSESTLPAIQPCQKKFCGGGFSMAVLTPRNCCSLESAQKWASSRSLYGWAIFFSLSNKNDKFHSNFFQLPLKFQAQRICLFFSLKNIFNYVKNK